ncbi:hypothetical protein [Streptomyces sp. NPDC050504]|uniref:hypothetical protein n=1 Tax=Streptomyces sp. NPDC050504 TaxID=3365618 RepID=UPI0037B9AF23
MLTPAHFALGLCGLLMALAVPGAFDDRGVLFGAAAALGGDDHGREPLGAA